MSQAAAMPSLPEAILSSPATTPNVHSQQQLSAKKLLGRLDELVSLAGAFRTATVAAHAAAETLAILDSIRGQERAIYM